MKKLLPIAVFLFIGQQIIAQGCNELFISEYAEGSGNNKGFEIYNPTNAAIDLGPYVLERWSNGANAVSDALDLQGAIPAYGTWVVVNGQTEDVDLGGGSISPAVDPLMQVYANQLDNPYPAPTYMNGDDALLLMKNGVAVDIFGKPGEDPGTAWTNNEAAGFTSEDGGDWLTANHTMKRKFDVTQGVTTVPLVFNAELQWDTLLNNTWTFFGTHACSCDPNAVPDNIVEEEAIQFELFPNPTVNKEFTVVTDRAIQKVEVYNQNGQLVKEYNQDFTLGRTTFEVNELAEGLYFVNVYYANKVTISQRLMIK
ncbi:MAG: lamin tail domain-containing protein [Flavobacteriales bacterium]